MGKVVYLLGAGASAGRIPVVNDMAADISNVIYELDSYGRKTDADNVRFGQNNDVKTLDKILKDLEYLHSGCINYSSIDTFAKKLFLTNKNEYKRLKLILSFYFTYKQIQEKPDLRYDNFWASILNHPDELPSNIRIISWNYDFQVEQSFINMTNSKDLATSANKINQYSHGCGRELDTKNFGLLKINGSAQFLDTQTNKSLYMCSGEKYFNNSLKEAIDSYKIIDSGNRYKCLLKFAWEETNHDVIYSQFVEMLRDASALAIIGYSFPFFNRAIDRMILSSLPGYSKIYIQDKNPNAIQQRVRQVAPRTYDCILIDDLAQFVFPIEL